MLLASLQALSVYHFGNFQFSSIQLYFLFLGVTQEEIDDKRVETEKQMLDDLKRWAAEGRDIDRDYKDINGATPVSS